MTYLVVSTDLEVREARVDELRTYADTDGYLVLRIDQRPPAYWSRALGNWVDIHRTGVVP